MNKLVILAISISGFLTGCIDVPELTSSNTKELELTITRIDPPKHVVIDMVDDDGNTYQHRSKHCNIYKQYQIGKKYKVTMTENHYSTNSGSHTSKSFSICGNHKVVPID